MLIVRHLGTPNSSSLLASLDATLCAIQYYPDQWFPFVISKKDYNASSSVIYNLYGSRIIPEPPLPSQGIAGSGNEIGQN